MESLKEKHYIITRDQFNIICNLIYRIEGYKESIQDLCSSKKPDIFYGFKLGEIYENISDIYVDLENLQGDIEKTESSKI